MDYSSESEDDLNETNQRKNVPNILEGEAIDCLICEFFLVLSY